MACKYCEVKTTKFEPVFISDTEEACKWCPKDKCDNYDDDCYGIGYGGVPVKYCPNCGEKLDIDKEVGVRKWNT